MRIALISYHFFNRTAEGLVTTKLVRALADRGHKLTVFTTGIEEKLTSPAVKQTILDGVELIIVPWPVAERPSIWDRLNHSGGWLGKRIAAIPGTIYGSTPLDQQWARAVESAVEAWVARDGLPDVLHSRLNHYVSHVAANRVKRRFPQLRWCAYFSDPWPYHLYPAPYFFTVGPVSRIRQEWLLRNWLDQADALVYPGERMRAYLLGGTWAKFRRHAHAIPHLGRIAALDPMPMTAPGIAGPRRNDGRLLLRHAGLLMKERRVEPLYNGMRRLFQECPDAKEALLIEFCGRGTVLADGTVDPRVAPPADLRPNIRIHGYRPPDEINAWLDEADAYLLVEAAGLKEGVFMPSKLADYMTGCRPLLALSPNVGEVADALKPGGGIVAEPNEPLAIAAALRQLYAWWRAGVLQEQRPTAAQAAPFTPPVVTPLYEAVLSPP